MKPAMNASISLAAISAFATKATCWTLETIKAALVFGAQNLVWHLFVNFIDPDRQGSGTVGGGGIGSGAIIGLVIGIILMLAAVGGVVIFVIVRRRYS